MNRRDWQLRLKAALPKEQYMLLDVVERPIGRFAARVLHPDTRAPIAEVALQLAPDPLPELQKILATARPPVDRDRTIIPHHPKT